MSISSFRGLAISGGGVAEVACVGSLRTWVKSGGVLNDYTHFSGTSAGAITATMLSLRAPIEFIESKLSTADFASFTDTTLYSKIEDIYGLWANYGWNSGSGLEKWIGDLIEELTGNRNITFKEAYDRFNKHLIVVKTDMLYPECQTVNMDYLSHPNYNLCLAVTTSCRIPLFYQSLHGMGPEEGHVFVDGGVLYNYPLHALYKYLPHDQCMGIVLRSDPENLILRPVRSFQDFITSMVNAWLRASTERHIHADDWKRTCSVSVTLSAIDFHADKTKIKEAIDQGGDAMVKFIESLKHPSLEDLIKEKDKIIAHLEELVGEFKRKSDK